MRRPAGPALHAAAALLALAATLALFWPGIILYDSVDQYSQILSGDYEDWHPPVMARLWSLLDAVWRGGAPMLLLQLTLYWLGLGLLAMACARAGRRGAGWAVLGIGGFLLLSCWMGAILKDAQMVGALAAAVGLIGWFRLQDRRPPFWTAALALLCLVYAMLVRTNAVFAVVPLGLGLFGWVGLAGWKARTAAAFGLAVAIILVSPLVNHGLLGAEPSGVEKSLLIYDIGGAEARAGMLPGPPGRRCYSPLEWDGLGEDKCMGAALLKLPTPALARMWLGTIAHHPIGYALHRLGHFDVNMRLFVPAGVPHALSPVYPESNDLGLGAEPGAALRAFSRLGELVSALPVAWPGLWLALDVIALWAAATAPPGPFRDLASALALSALAMGASFLVVSVAADLRYHLWTMLAAMLAFPLLAAVGALQRRHLIAAFAVMVAVAAIGTAGRLWLAPLA